MASTKELLRFLSLITVAGCVTSGTPDEGGTAATSRGAERTFVAADTALSRAARSIGSAAPLTGTVNVTAACARGGDIGLAGTFDTGGAGTSFDVNATFRDCAEAEGAIDGSLRWTSAVTGARVEETWRGALDVTDASGTYHCAIDLHSVVDGTGVSYTGTICGFDVETELDVGR